MLAFDLVAAYSQSVVPFYTQDASAGPLELNEAPRELTLRFTPGVAIDSNTLGSISILRTGGDGQFGNGNDTPLVLGGAIGSVLVDDAPNANQIIIRFAETLPDDTYQIVVGAGLRSDTAEAVNPTTLTVRLNLGAYVTSVVPQPVTRSTTFTLPADPSRIQDGDLLEVTIRGGRKVFEFDRNGTVAAGNTPIVIASQTSAQLAAAVAAAITVAPEFTGERGAIPTVTGSTVEVTGLRFTPLVKFTPRAALLPGAVPAVTVGDGTTLTRHADTVVVYFNRTDTLNKASAETPAWYRLIALDPVTGATIGTQATPGAVAYDAVSGTAVLTFAAGVVQDDRLYRLQIGQDATGPLTAVTEAEGFDNPLAPFGTTTSGESNSSFATAEAVGALTAGGITVTGAIQPRTVVATPVGDLEFPNFPGTVDEPGHRDIVTTSGGGQHGQPFAEINQAGAVTVVFYNFQSNYGNDPQGNPLQNVITEAQKQRAREIFELYSRYTGLRFVESDTFGITVVTGDMRALDPNTGTGPLGLASVGDVTTGKAIMDSTDDWGESEYGGLWFKVAMHEIGHTLGLTHADDVPCVMSWALDAAIDQATPIEPSFPHDYDIVHVRQLFQPNGSDVDLYRFTLAQAGRVTLETVIARPGQPVTSLLDSVLTLYREDPFTGKREAIARNDDSIGRDSVLELDLEKSKTELGVTRDYAYYVAVSSTGNIAFNPEVSASGFGGRSDGAYQLQVSLAPKIDAIRGIGSTIRDVDGTALDGDRDGTAGGVFSFWFNTAATAKTVYVDKAAPAAGAAGTLSNPYTTISAALAAAEAANAATPGSTTLIRVLGNAAQTPYVIGTDAFGRPIAGGDGTTFDVPAGVTVMIDEGAVFKLNAAIIDVGSSQPGSVSRANAAIQVLGTPDRAVTFTSWRDDSIGGNTDGNNAIVPAAGQWGGIVLRQDSDVASKQAFVNSISQATFRYGGGDVVVDSTLEKFAPIQVESTRPTIAFNTITASAAAAIQATPNSFDESNGRSGPEIRGNRLTDNSINGVFLKIDTQSGEPLETLGVAARFKSTDVVYVITENLLIEGGVGGYILTPAFVLQARASGRLTIDPGVIVKLQESRIELERGVSQLIAEGLPNERVIFTSLGDNRYGAGGTFDTNGSQADKFDSNGRPIDAAGASIATPAGGDWGGIVLNAGSEASIDFAYIAFGGGTTPIEGRFARFNVIETHQGDLRLANSRIEFNDGGDATGDDRNGRGENASATVFVRGAQPIIAWNDFRQNVGATVSVNVNSLTEELRFDVGRTGSALLGITQFNAPAIRHDDNFGPLVVGNRLTYTAAAVAAVATGGTAIAGMEVRGEEVTVESVWDDTDIVHVLRSAVQVNELHTATGLRLVSQPDSSLVIKLSGATAGITAAGEALDIDDRIGGTVQIVGQPGRPVVLTSLADDTVGAGLDAFGRPVTDTNADGGATHAQPGDWRSLEFLEYSNDRNVAIFVESESGYTGGIDANNSTASAQALGVLAPNYATGINSWESAQEKSGDENRRLGFEVHGFVAADDPTDVDLYSFIGYAGSEVWIDIDKTSSALDSMVELLDASGRVLARSVDSGIEGGVVQGETITGTPGAGTTETYPLAPRTGLAPGAFTVAGINGVITDNSGLLPVDIQTFAIDAAGNVTFHNVLGADRLGTPTVPTSYATGATVNALGQLVITYDTAPVVPMTVAVRYSYRTTALTTTTLGTGALGLGKDVWRGGDYYALNPKDAGMRLVLPGTQGQQTQYVIRVRSQPGYGATTTPVAYETDLQNAASVNTAGRTSGGYELRVRLRQRDEKPGSTVRYADIRYATTAIDVRGLPRNSPLLGETGEHATDANDAFAGAQNVGSLFQADRNTISIAGRTSAEGDIDWYAFDFTTSGGIPGASSFATMFDIDYGDGFRGDLSLAVYDANGRLVFMGRDSDVANDQPASAAQGTDFDDLSRGSNGKLDPYIGSTHLPSTGTYYVAVTSNERLPDVLQAYYVAGATRGLARLEPVSSLDRIAEDHVGDNGELIDTDTAANGNLNLNVHVTPFALSDVTLFVTTGGSLVTVDAMQGGTETTISTSYAGQTISDIVMRSDGRLYSYSGLPGVANTAGRLDLLDSGNGGRTAVGNDSIPNLVPATTPTATEVNVAPQQLGAAATSTFQLANGNLTAATLTGTLQYSGIVAGLPAVGTWTFASDAAGALTFTPAAVPAGITTPLTGTVNAATGLVSVTWNGPVVMTGVSLVTTTYTYTKPGDPNSVTTDTVDAMAWNWSSVTGANALYYSVFDPVAGASRLYRADPTTGSAAAVTGQPWGRIGGATGFIQNAGGALGITRGMAFVGGTLYGVDNLGNFYTINTGTAVATLIATVAGAPAFSGLTRGPQNLEGGRYASWLFAITGGGGLYCLNTAGALQTVFDANGDGVAEATTIATGAGGATGLAFSPLDINLWHPSTKRGTDLGHGIEVSPDGLRTARSAGGSTMYFGLENLTGSQFGGGFAWQQDLLSNTAIGDNYNLPGGAYGSLMTNQFSLASYVYTDKPTLYFNYYLDTQNSQGRVDEMRDSARVLVSINGGLTWELLATNNQLKSDSNTENAELPVSPSASSRITGYTNQKVQELFDISSWTQSATNPGWRQARIDLGEFAGQANVRLRFDFSTAGEMSATDVWRTTQIVTAATTTATVALTDVSNLFVGLTAIRRSGTTVTVLGTVAAVSPVTNTVTLAAAATLAAGDLITFVDTANGNLLNTIVDDIIAPTALGLAATTGDFSGTTRSAQRGQNNAFEGFHVDDIIIGFAERGEMVTAADDGQTAFFDTNTQDTAAQTLFGEYQLEIRRGTEYADVQTFDTNDPLISARSTTTNSGAKVGDENLLREQGQFVIDASSISNSRTYGISIDAGARDAGSSAPHQGVVRNLPTLTGANLVPGAVVSNNLIVGSGQAGIRFSGDTSTATQPAAAIPFGRIVNNTIYGGNTPTGTGIAVTDNAGPTLLNNLFANLANGVTVDASSRTDGAGRLRTVVGTSAYWNTMTQVNTGTTQSNQIVLTGNPFVNAASGNFYLAAGSRAIDSSLNSLQDRVEYRQVTQAVSLPASPILAPERDLYGQLRLDDPTQGSLAGLGSNVFKDRGAIDRADFANPIASLALPLDQGTDDRNSTYDAVTTRGGGAAAYTRFELQLTDRGAGIDPATVTPAAFTIVRNGTTTLVNQRDYTFFYDAATGRVIFEAASVFALGSYQITVARTIADVAGNLLLPNKTNDTTTFTITLVDVPGRPTSLAGVAGDGSVTLTWVAPVDNGTPITNYVVWWSTDGINWAPTSGQLTGSTATTYTVTGLTNGTPYYFRVAAVNDAGQGPYAQILVPIMPRQPAPAPLTLAALRGDKQVTLSWTTPTPTMPGETVTGFWVQYRVYGGGGVWQPSSPALRSSPTTVTGLTNGVRYEFRVTTITNLGTGLSATVVSMPVGLPLAPTGLVVTPGNGSVTARWNAVTTGPATGGLPLTGYLVQWRTSTGVWTPGLAVGPVSTATITGLVNNTAYFVRVAARNAQGLGPFATLSTPVTPRPLASAPTRLTARAGDGSAALAWTAPTNTGGVPIVNYAVQYSTDSVNWLSLPNTGSNLARATVVVPNGRTYVFRVAAITAWGTGAFSAASPAVTPMSSTVLPAAPTSLTVTNPSSRQAGLTWVAPPANAGGSVTGYVVQYRLSTSATWASVSTTTTYASISNLVSGGTYVFRVQARNLSGLGAFSAERLLQII